MKKKYIIELEDYQQVYATTIIDGVSFIKLLQPLPYTAPDLEKVRQKAYDRGVLDAGKEHENGYSEGYDKGLNDAWEAARRLWEYDINTLHKIFGVAMRMDCYTKFTASEVIAKINAWEDSKQEEELGIQGYFKNGEEVIDTNGTKAVILHVSEDNYCQVYMENGCIENWHIHTYKFHKTGRYFPEIAAVLEKMREGQEQ